MSDVERIFDRFIDAFAEDLLEIARAYIDVEVGRALAVAQRTNAKESKAQVKASKAQLKADKRSQRLAKKAQLKLAKQQAREESRAARLADKERIKTERAAEQAERQVEHDRLKQERLALKHELEAERRRLREASRKRPVRQLPLDFDGLSTPKPRRRDTQAPGSPPQLFVHKRKRDGQIEKLSRTDESPAGVTNGGAIPAPLMNGAAVAAPIASASAE